MGKSLTKPILIALSILLVIVGIVCLVLYLVTDLFKSPGTLFSKYFIKNFSYVQDLGYEPYSNLNKIIGQRTFDESANIMIKANNNRTYEFTNKFVSDSVNSKLRNTLTFKILGQDVNIIFNKDLDLYSINLNNITTKKLAIRNSNLKKVLESIGYNKTQYVPNKIGFNPYKSYNEDKFNEANKKFLKMFQDSIDKSCFKKDKKAVVSYNGQNVDANMYYVVTDGKTVVTFIDKVITEFKDNPATYDVYSNFFGLEHDTFISILTYLKDRLSNYITNHELSDSTFQVNVYEYKGELVDTEIIIDKARLELKFNKEDGVIAAQYLYNNIDYSTFQTDLYRNITFKNEYSSDSSIMTIDYAFRKKKNDNVFDESNYKIKITLNNITESGANRTVSITKNNALIFNYDSIISIDIDAQDLDNISQSNSYILNDASSDELSKMNQELKSHLGEILNILSIIPYKVSSNTVSNNTGDDSHQVLLINNNDANTVRDDLNNAFTSLCANYLLNPEGAGSLSEYLTVNRIRSKTMYAQEINILEGNIIEYYNQNGNIFRVFVEILGDKVNILNIEMFIPEIADPEVEPEPEPEPEPEQRIEQPTVVPDPVEPEPETPAEPVEDNRDHEAIGRMKDDINNLLPLIEQQAAIDERSIDDFVTADNFVNNCPNIVRMDIDEQSAGMYLIKAYDEAGNVGSGILQVFEYGINLLIFD